MDLDRQLRCPQHVIKTALRPDIVLVSDAMKNIVMLEITVPWEDCMEEANERGKYECLISDCHVQNKDGRQGAYLFL